MLHSLKIILLLNRAQCIWGSVSYGGLLRKLSERHSTLTVLCVDTEYVGEKGGGVHKIGQISLVQDFIIWHSEQYIVYRNPLSPGLLCLKENPLMVLRTVWPHAPPSAI